MFKNRQEKWSREECFHRYVYGERITTRALAELANRPHSTIGKWSGEDKYTEARKQNENTVRTKTAEKVGEYCSDAYVDRYGDRISKVNEEHLEGFAFIRKMARTFAEVMAGEIDEITELKKRRQRVANKEFSMSAQRYGALFAQMAEMERRALGMQYLDINVAMGKVMKEGYEVSNPAVEFMIAHLEHEGYSVAKTEKQKQLSPANR